MTETQPEEAFSGDVTPPPILTHATWPPGSQVMLCSVPWDAAYAHTVWYNSDNDFLDYLESISSKSIVVSQMTYVKPYIPVNVPTPFSEAQKYNYLYVYNSETPNDGPLYFAYFILHCEYVAPNTTRLVLQLDVWQTYVRRLTIGRGFVERGHIGIAAQECRNNPREYLTTPEGLDIGSNYSTRELAIKIIDSSLAVIVISTIDLHGDTGTQQNPKFDSAGGSSINGIPQGCNVYYFTVANYELMLNTLKPKPWITQGIISATIAIIKDSNVTLTPITVGSVQGGLITKFKPYEQLSTSVDKSHVVNFIPARYRSLVKFTLYPYCAFECTMFNGKPLVMQPELMPDGEIKFDSYSVIVPPGVRYVLFPRAYNRDTLAPDEIEGVAAKHGDTLDFSTGITDMPQLSVVNDGYQLYMANNRNSINYQYQTADWSQQMAQASASNAYLQATNQMTAMSSLGAIGRNTASQSQQISHQAQSEMMMLNGALGVLKGGMGGAMSGAAAGPWGAVGGAAGGVVGGAAAWGIEATTLGMQQDVANKQLNLSNNASLRSQNVNMSTSMAARDANQDLAMFASKGSYENAIAGIKAKIQDAKLTPPSVAGQVGGDGFYLQIFKRYQFNLRVKLLQPIVYQMIGEHWLRYGYMMNRYTNVGHNILCMSKFTFWKVTDLFITEAQCPETFKQTIRGIFEKGVTIWRQAHEIGTIDPVNNTPLSNVKIEG